MNPDQLRIFFEIEQRHWWFVARRNILARFVHHALPPGNRPSVLDIGCGTGGNLGALQSEYRCVGVDASPAAIEFAKKQNPAVEFIYSPTEADLGRLAGDAKMVLMMDVLEHVADDFAFFSRIAAAVQPGTHLLLTVPADMSLWSKHDQTVLHYRRYDEERFRAVWEGLPFETLLVSHFNSRLYPIIKFTRWLNRLRGQSLGVAGMDFVLPPAPLNRLLTRIFAGEGDRLFWQLKGGQAPFRRGVSLIALLKRRPGPSPVRSKPANLAPDPHLPHSAVVEP